MSYAVLRAFPQIFHPPRLTFLRRSETFRVGILAGIGPSPHSPPECRHARTVSVAFWLTESRLLPNRFTTVVNRQSY